MTQASGVTSELDAIYAADPTHVWAVGVGGVILFYNGTSWSPQASGTTVKLRGVHGTGPSNVWAVGDAGTILRFDGSKWSPQTSGTTFALGEVFAVSPTNIYVVGQAGVAIHSSNGTTWTAEDSGSSNFLFGVWGTAANLFAVGGTGTILEKKI